MARHLKGYVLLAAILIVIGIAACTQPPAPTTTVPAPLTPAIATVGGPTPAPLTPPVATVGGPTPAPLTPPVATVGGPTPTPLTPAIAAAGGPTGTGLKMAITDVTIGADRKPVVSFAITDAGGKPLATSDLDGYPRFTIAYLQQDPDTKLTSYVNYVVADAPGAPFQFDGKTVQPALPVAKARPNTDPLPSPVPTWPAPAPSFKQSGPGIYTYTFTTALPDGYDRTATHTVGGQATRQTRKYVANPLYDFVPAGGSASAKVTHQVVATQNCNQCHDPLALHGASRVETGYCVLCHTSQNVDPNSGNVLDLKVMVHKLHRGDNLPSVLAGTPYFVGNDTHDFSDVAFPQDVRNCTTCHSNAPQADNWKTAPSRAACGSCHDNIDFATGKAQNGGKRDHSAGPQADDKACAACHPADSGVEFDASVVGAHTIPANSTQLKGIKFTLLGATAKPGEKPAVDFQIQDNSGAAQDPNTMTSLEATYAYPTTDYAQRVTESVNAKPAPPATFTRVGTLADLGGGKWRYTFKDPIPADWQGSIGVGMAGYRNATIKGNEGQDTVVREGNVNPVIYVSLDGSKPVARRAVVQRDSCNQCHKDLGSPAGFAIHGGTRRSPEYCVMCHNANLTDEARRTPAQMPPETLHWDYMLHSLHMGQDRAVPATFVALKTSAITYPGDQRDCAKCHAAGTNLLPLPAGALSTTITQGGIAMKVIPPVAAACTGCHSGDVALSHVETMTSATKVETCTVCHAKGKEFDVAAMHSP